MRRTLLTRTSVFCASILVVACSDHRDNVVPTVTVDTNLQPASPLEMRTSGLAQIDKVTDWQKVMDAVTSWKDPTRTTYESTEEFEARLHKSREELATALSGKDSLMLVDLDLESSGVTYDPDTEMISIRPNEVSPRDAEYSLAFACAGGPNSGLSGDQLCAQASLRDAFIQEKQVVESSLQIPMSRERAELLQVSKYGQKLALFGYVKFAVEDPWVPQDAQNFDLDVKSKASDIDMEARKFSPFYEVKLMTDRTARTQYRTDIAIGDIKSIVLVETLNNEILAHWDR